MLWPMWRSTTLTTKTKLRVFGSNVKTVLLHSSETWRSTKKLEQKLQMFVNKSLRTSCEFGDLEKSATRRQVRQRAWGWIGHMLRRPDGHVVKRAQEWNPQGKRKRARPQHTWRRTRMAELESKHITWNETKGTVQNRVRWHALVEDLCSTRSQEE